MIRAKRVRLTRGFGTRACQAGDEIERLDNIAGSDFEPPQADPKGEGQDARSHPATLPTPSSKVSSQAGSVCSVNTLRPCCGPTAMR